MEEHVNFITRFLNLYLGPFALSILTALHIKPSNPQLPIPQHVSMGLLVLVIGTVFALVGSISIFILISNLMGVFPFLSAPTGVVTVPLACAILTFLYFNWQGIRHHGVLGYLGTFAGSPKDFGAWVLAVLLFSVEIISTTARLLSLTVRLWANMFASELIYGIFLSLLAGGATFGWSKSPLLGVFLGLHIFVSVVQAYVFTVLPAVYLGLATGEEH